MSIQAVMHHSLLVARLLPMAAFAVGGRREGMGEAQEHKCDREKELV